MVELLQGHHGDISLKVDMAEGRSASWSNSEVKALLAIWAEDTFQQELEIAKRNKAIFDEISRQLLESDIRRDWKQCRAKIKNLKTLYRKLWMEIKLVVVQGLHASFLTIWIEYLEIDLRLIHLTCWSLQAVTTTYNRISIQKLKLGAVKNLQRTYPFQT